MKGIRTWAPSTSLGQNSRHDAIETPQRPACWTKAVADSHRRAVRPTPTARRAPAEPTSAGKVGSQHVDQQVGGRSELFEACSDELLVAVDDVQTEQLTERRREHVGDRLVRIASG